MNIKSIRRGFTVVELLALVGVIGVGASVASVSMGLGSIRTNTPATASPSTPSQPEDATDKKIEAIRKQLDTMRKQIDGIESELDGLQAQNEKPAGLLSALGKARASARQLKDATQVRGIQQSFIIWANQNQGQYPLPSKVDKAGETVAGDAAAKDTTANIFSMLVYNGYVSPEICISPAEANPNIKVCDNYEFDQPKTAVKPAMALWDPAFSADFANGKTGNVSYGHIQPFGGRTKLWADTFNAAEPVIGNRGPQIQSVTRNPQGSLVLKSQIPDSITYLIHGDRESWQGNLAYNDGHVAFETTLVGDIDNGWPAYVNKEDKRTPDVFFFDEQDAKEPSTNIYIGIFTKSGKALEDWTAIWD